MIGIIGAMRVEIAKIGEFVENKITKKIGGMEFTEGTLLGKPVVLCVCGIGKVFAAICAQTMILTYNPVLIINTGVAGNLSLDLKIGNIAIANAIVQHDMDTSPLGDPVGMVSGINVINFMCDDSATDGISNACAELGFPYKRGIIASGDQFISDGKRKKIITKNFNAIACDMEAAAIAQTCYVNGVKFAAIRAISDDADGNAPSDFMEFVEHSSIISSEVISKFFKIFKM